LNWSFTTIFQPEDAVVGAGVGRGTGVGAGVGATVRTGAGAVVLRAVGAVDGRGVLVVSGAVVSPGAVVASGDDGTTAVPAEAAGDADVIAGSDETPTPRLTLKEVANAVVADLVTTFTLMT
jgi:hypothetical protein